MKRFPFSKELLSDFDKELLSSNLVGAKTLDELFELEQNMSNCHIYFKANKSSSTQSTKDVVSYG